MAVRGERRGISGWKAFALVVGSGLTAAFIVFLVVVGVLNTLASSISSSGKAGGQVDAGAATGSAHESLPPGKLDLCTTTINDIGTVSLTRVDGDEDYSDSLESAEKRDSGVRTVVDDCEWTLAPEVGGALEQWNLKFSYTGFIPSASSGSMQEKAEEKYRTDSEGITAKFSDSSAGGAVDFSDESKVVFGVDKDDGNSGRFEVVGRIKSVAYHVSIVDPNGTDESSAVYEYEIEKMLKEVSIDVNQWVPDDAG